MEIEKMYLQSLHLKKFINPLNAKETVIIYGYFKLCFNIVNIASVFHH